MRRYSLAERRAWAKLRPHDRRDWHQLRVLCGYVALIAIFVSTMVYLKHRHREDLDKNWVSALAIIKDVRYEQMEIVDTPISGAILYRVAVLVKYQSEGVTQERWVTVDQRPTSLAGAKLQAFRWKGK